MQGFDFTVEAVDARLFAVVNFRLEIKLMKNTCIHNVKPKAQRTLLFMGTMLEVNYIARTSTAGKEFDMVIQYINSLIEKYEKLKKKRAAIFVEPQLDTGYPDIVVVEFYSIPQQQWSMMRNSLSITDIKILFYIQTHGYSKIYDLQNTLGFSQELLLKSVLRLKDCGLVHIAPQCSSVRPVSLKSYCRVNKVISIEAKIDKWNEAIRQAGNNIWFSTESYILMNKDSCSDCIQAACRERGIGIILVNGRAKTILTSNRRKFPVSYASLQFNEWILRYMNMRGE